MPRLNEDHLTGLIIAGVAWVFLMTILLAAALSPEGKPKNWQERQLEYCKHWVPDEDKLDCMRAIDAKVHN